MRQFIGKDEKPALKYKHLILLSATNEIQCRSSGVYYIIVVLPIWCQKWNPFYYSLTWSCCNSLFKDLFIYFIYLKGRSTKREEKTQRVLSSICWLTSQMAPTARAGSGQNKKPPGSPTKVAEGQALEPSSNAFPGALAKGWIRNRAEWNSN